MNERLVRTDEGTAVDVRADGRRDERLAVDGRAVRPDRRAGGCTRREEDQRGCANCTEQPGQTRNSQRGRTRQIEKPGVQPCLRCVVYKHGHYGCSQKVYINAKTTRMYGDQGTYRINKNNLRRAWHSPQTPHYRPACRSTSSSTL